MHQFVEAEWRMYGYKAIIGLSNGKSLPIRHQAIVWTNTGLLHIGTLEKHFSEVWIKIQSFALEKMNLETIFAKWLSFCIGIC